MLVLSRRVNESILVDHEIRITVLEVHGSRVRLGIEAPSHVSLKRAEVWIDRSDMDHLTATGA